jgi:hypothetical protein
MDGLHHTYSPASNHIAFWHMPVNHPDYPTALLQTIREPMLVYLGFERNARTTFA